MGEAASPVCFELAKRLKRAPRQIAQEIAIGLGRVEGIAKLEVAGGGDLNAYFDLGALWGRVQAGGSGEKNKGQSRGPTDHWGSKTGEKTARNMETGHRNLRH